VDTLSTVRRRTRATRCIAANAQCDKLAKVELCRQNGDSRLAEVKGKKIAQVERFWYSIPDPSQRVELMDTLSTVRRIAANALQTKRSLGVINLRDGRTMLTTATDGRLAEMKGKKSPKFRV